MLSFGGSDRDRLVETTQAAYVSVLGAVMDWVRSQAQLGYGRAVVSRMPSVEKVPGLDVVEFMGSWPVRFPADLRARGLDVREVWADGDGGRVLVDVVVSWFVDGE